jgi:hypothetical protein
MRSITLGPPTATQQGCAHRAHAPVPGRDKQRRQLCIKLGPRTEVHGHHADFAARRSPIDQPKS